MAAAAPIGIPGVMLGSLVGVIVGVNNSAPIIVTVGVKVSGVAVEVANIFWVGMGVSLANGVREAVGAAMVVVARNWGKLIFGKLEQPARKTTSTRI